MRWWIVAVVVGCATPVVTPQPPPPAARRVARAAAPVDSDDDGVPDVCDWCPREPGVNRLDHLDGRGCPWIDCFALDVLYGSKPIRFARDRTAPPDLAELAAKMRDDKGERFIIVGHASSDEKDPEGTALERARNVMAALVAGGVDEKRLETHGAGAARAMESAAESRRVEIELAVWCHHKRAWNESFHEVVNVSWGELPSCPPELRL